MDMLVNIDRYYDKNINRMKIVQNALKCLKKKKKDK